MAFRNFLKGFISAPVVRADDAVEEEEEPELVDPQVTLREKCHNQRKIQGLYKKYQECNDRVNSRSKTAETCMEELFDYVGELDHCVVHHGLFSQLK